MLVPRRCVCRPCGICETRTHVGAGIVECISGAIMCVVETIVACLEWIVSGAWRALFEPQNRSHKDSHMLVPRRHRRLHRGDILLRVLQQVSHVLLRAIGKARTDGTRQTGRHAHDQWGGMILKRWAGAFILVCDACGVVKRRKPCTPAPAQTLLRAHSPAQQCLVCP